MNLELKCYQASRYEAEIHQQSNVITQNSKENRSMRCGESSSKIRTEKESMGVFSANAHDKNGFRKG